MCAETHIFVYCLVVCCHLIIISLYRFISFFFSSLKNYYKGYKSYHKKIYGIFYCPL
jgi:hypothetical protein